MAKKNCKVRFVKLSQATKGAFVFYADFEALIRKINGCQPNDKKSYTETYQSHKYCSYGYKVVCCYDDKYSKPINIYRGENGSHKLMENMIEELKWCQDKIENFKDKIILTKEDEANFKTSKKCHICNKNTPKKTSGSKTIVMSLGNTGVQLIKTAA